MTEGRKFRVGRFHIAGVVVVGVAAVAAFQVWRIQNIDLAEARSVRATTLAQGPRVQVVQATRGPSERVITLLADVRPFQNAILYGKVSGYLKHIAVDRGDKVQAGQILAEIESAETDNQYNAAVADLDNKKKLAARSRELLARGITAQQTAEQAETNERMAQSLVSQLAALKSYEIIRAPFTGTVTARFADPGALIQNAATNQTASLPVITLSDSSKLRVSVYVGQTDVPYVRLGDTVEVYDATSPDRRLKAVVSRTAEMLDPQTRTLLVEIDVDNADGFLFPGSFAYVALRQPAPSYVRIPVTGVKIRNNERLVAVVSDNAIVQFRRVTVASTDGVMVDIADGLQVGERIALSVPDDVTEGSKVQPVEGRAR